MKRISFGLVALMIAAASWTPASAEGALAIGATTNVAQHGVAIGLSTEFGTSKAASRDALSQCKRSDVKAATRALCRVVTTFSGQCAAIAMDPKVGTPGFGWAVAASTKQAGKAALANCNKVGGSTRRGACRVIGSDCDS